MKITVITDPEFLPHEAEACAALLGAGAWRLHIRKPCSKEEDTAALIEAIPQQYYSRISLHDHLPLIFRYGLGGVHLNARNDGANVIQGLSRDPSLTPSPISISRSCHSLSEVTAYKPESDYLFLSPVFDSISKHGYMSGFRLSELESASASGLIDSRVFALGGVSPAGIPLLSRCGFGGAAVLGYIWEQYKSDLDIKSAVQRLRKMIKPDPQEIRL